MRRWVVSALVGLAALGCGGLGVDAAGMKATVSAIHHVAPGDVAATFLEGGTEAGLGGPLCGRCLAAMVHLDAADWGPIGARTLTDPSCACPTTCVTDLLAHPPDDPIAAADQVCAADEDLFTGPLTPLRAVSPVVPQGMVRALIRDMAPADLDAARETLAVGVAALGGVSLAPADALVAVGAAKELLTERTDALAACGDDVAHRLLVAPDGRVRAVVGPPGCVADVLLGVELDAAEAWRVVDLAWAASGMVRAEPSPPEDPAEEAPPLSPVPDANAPAPSPTPPPQAALRKGRVEVEGQLDAVVAERVLRRGVAGIRGCYERVLAADPGAKGTLTATLQIGGQGAVSSVDVSTDMGGDLSACVAAKLEPLAFPASGDGKPVKLVLPLVFGEG